MTNSQSYEYGEILGALMAIQNFSQMDNRQDFAQIESTLINNAIDQMQTLFDSLSKEHLYSDTDTKDVQLLKAQAQEINRNLQNIIK
jgi:hypothetical protein